MSLSLLRPYKSLIFNNTIKNPYKLQYNNLCIKRNNYECHYHCFYSDTLGNKNS